MSNTSSQSTTSVASTSVQSDQSDQDVVVAAKGGGIAFAGRVFEYGSRFAIGILLARLLGADQYGLYTLALSAESIIGGLALLGMHTAVVRYVPLFASRRDTAGLWGTLQVVFGLPAIASLIAGVGLYVLANPIAERWFHEPRLVPLLRLTSLIIPFFTLSTIAAAATRGFKKMQYMVIAQNITHPLIKLVLMIVLAVTGLTVKGALASHLIATVIVLLMLLHFLNRLFSLNRPWRTGHRDVKGLLGFSMPLYLTGLIATFRGNLQSLLLGTWDSITGVGVFAVASRVNLVGQMFHSSVVVASMPVVSELYEREDWQQLRRFYQTTSRWTFTLNLPLFLIVILFPGPILSVFGQSFADGVVALTILAWVSLVKTGTGICGVLIDMTGNTHLKLVNSVVTTSLTVGLNFLLVPRWGVTGAAAAALATISVSNLIIMLEVFVLFRLLPYDVSYLKPFTAGLSALLVAFLLNQLSSAEVSPVFAAINAVVLVVVYTGVILLLGLTEEDRVILARLRRRLRVMVG